MAGGGKNENEDLGWRKKKGKEKGRKYNNLKDGGGGGEWSKCTILYTPVIFEDYEEDSKEQPFFICIS